MPDQEIVSKIQYLVQRNTRRIVGEEEMFKKAVPIKLTQDLQSGKSTAKIMTPPEPNSSRERNRRKSVKLSTEDRRKSIFVGGADQNISAAFIWFKADFVFDLHVLYSEKRLAGIRKKMKEEAAEKKK